MNNLDTIRDAFEECGMTVEPRLYEYGEDGTIEYYIDLPGGTRLYFDKNGKFTEAV